MRRFTRGKLRRPRLASPPVQIERSQHQRCDGGDDGNDRKRHGEMKWRWAAQSNETRNPRGSFLPGNGHPSRKKSIPPGNRDEMLGPLRKGLGLVASVASGLREVFTAALNVLASTFHGAAAGEKQGREKDRNDSKQRKGVLFHSTGTIAGPMPSVVLSHKYPLINGL